MKKLNEGKAADQAHQLGLVYMGHGYWAQPSNPDVAVARTLNDKLLKVKKGENAPQDSDFQKDASKNWGWHVDDDEPFAGYEPFFDLKKMAIHTPDSYKMSHGLGKTVVPKGTTTFKFPSKPETQGDMDNIMFTKYGDATGTNEGGFYIGKDGIKRYVKLYKNEPEKAFGEVLSNCIYEDLGLAAPKSQYFEMGDQAANVGFASEIVGGDPKELAEYIKDAGMIKASWICDKILDGFCADCLVANWDVVGVNEGYMRNILVYTDTATPEPVRIDQGGSFLSRGLNGKKADQFGEHVLYQLSEWNIFTESNPSYNKVFKLAGVEGADALGAKRVKAQVKKILDLHAKHGSWEKYVNEKIPAADSQDRTQMIKMLNERTKLLIAKAKSL